MPWVRNCSANTKDIQFIGWVKKLLSFKIPFLSAWEVANQSRQRGDLKVGHDPSVEKRWSKSYTSTHTARDTGYFSLSRLASDECWRGETRRLYVWLKQFDCMAGTQNESLVLSRWLAIWQESPLQINYRVKSAESVKRARVTHWRHFAICFFFFQRLMLRPPFLNRRVATQKWVGLIGSRVHGQFEILRVYIQKKQFSSVTLIPHWLERGKTFHFRECRGINLWHHDNEKQCGFGDSTSCHWFRQRLEPQALHPTPGYERAIDLSCWWKSKRTNAVWFIGWGPAERRTTTHSGSDEIDRIIFLPLDSSQRCRWWTPPPLDRRQRGRCAFVSPSLIDIACGAVVKPNIEKHTHTHGMNVS